MYKVLIMGLVGKFCSWDDCETYEDALESYDRMFNDDFACFIVDPNGKTIKTNLVSDEDEEEPIDDCDYEVGFDPYMGCFSFDC